MLVFVEIWLLIELQEQALDIESTDDLMPFSDPKPFTGKKKYIKFDRKNVTKVS